MKLHKTSHRIETAFILALFTMFAATAILVVLIGAKQYRITADSMNTNYEVRTTASYLEEKIRQNDTAGAIYAADLLGVPALAIESTEADTVYTTYIYYYEDYLRELFVTDSSVFSLESGQSILALSGFEVESLTPDLIRASYTGTDGQTCEVYLSIHSAGGKEDT
jgi:preprotein translocase subunit SecY